MKRFDQNKKTYFLLIAVFLIANFGLGQIINWHFKSYTIKDGVYSVSIKAAIAKSWHIYSQVSHEDGPTPTKITFNSNPLIRLEGKVIEKGKKIKHFEEVFDFDVEYYEDSVEFSQLVRFNAKQKFKTNITGTVEYMLCTNGKCLSPAKENFSIALQ
jgi:hypothetical protein